MQVLTLEKNRGYLIAGTGAIVALFAFLFLPFIAVVNVSAGQTTLLNVSDIAQDQLSIWIEGLAAVTAITIAALIVFRPVPFSMLRTTAPIEIQIRWGTYLLILAGIFGVLTPLMLTLTLSGLENYSYSSGVSASFASGAWLSLVGMIAVVVGGVLALRAKNNVPQYATGTYSQYPPLAQPQPWAGPVDPYASGAPQQQWNAGQTGQTGQPTLPSQQQWNSGQPVPPMQPQWNTGQQMPPMQQQWNPGTGQPTLPAQQPQWNPGTGQPTLPSQQPQWNPGTGQPVPPQQQPQWNPGQQLPPGPPYQ